MAATLWINGVRLAAHRGATLFDCAERAGVRVSSSCQRSGTCGECIVQVVEGAALLSPPDKTEQHLSHGFRLACRASIEVADGNLIYHTLRRGRMRIVQQADMDEPDSGMVRHDPAVQRRGNGIHLDGRQIDTRDGPIYGIALDVGTTSVVLVLVDLETGEKLATTAFENPQTFGGSDVMSRIAYDHQHDGRLLQKALLGYLVHAIGELPCAGRDIYEIAVVGNTTMRDLLFGVNIWPIGQKPYRSVVEQAYRDGRHESTALTTPGQSLGLPIHPAARVFSLPLISSHVGADAAACLAAIDIAHQDRPVVLMDIGTNTELIIGCQDRIFAASCPAGPAFEGGGITCGMPAFPGAIERISINDHGQMLTQTIDHQPPAGICGSGLVDLLSELLRTGRMQPTGRLRDGNHVAVAPDRRITLSESDISRLAQAKAANTAGLQIVMKQYGIDWEQIDRFYLAGGFAKHLDLTAAKRIGLIPNLPDERFHRIGNAAIQGAVMALCSASLRHEIQALARRVEHVELEADPSFFDHFVQGCLFEPI